MRLFLATDASTHILMVSSDISFDDFKTACQAKCRIEEACIELDVEGAPAVSDINEVRDGDRLKVKKVKRLGEDKAGTKSSTGQAAGASHATPLPTKEIPITYKEIEDNQLEFFCEDCQMPWTCPKGANNTVTRQRAQHVRKCHPGCAPMRLKTGSASKAELQQGMPSKGRYSELRTPSEAVGLSVVAQRPSEDEQFTEAMGVKRRKTVIYVESDEEDSKWEWEDSKWDNNGAACWACASQ